MKARDRVGLWVPWLARDFAGYRWGRFRVWPFVGFWGVGSFTIGDTRVVSLGFARVFVEPKVVVR